MPTNITIASVAIVISVADAFFASVDGRRDAVRHGLDAGHRRAAVRERVSSRNVVNGLLSGVRPAAAHRPATMPR
jgi:hypothetical protein